MNSYSTSAEQTAHCPLTLLPGVYSFAAADRKGLPPLLCYSPHSDASVLHFVFALPTADTLNGHPGPRSDQRFAVLGTKVNPARF